MDVSAEMKMQPNNYNRKNEILSPCCLALGNLVDRSSNPKKLWRSWRSGVGIVSFKSSVLLGNAYPKIAGFLKLYHLKSFKFQNQTYLFVSETVEKGTMAAIYVSASCIQRVLWCVYHPFFRGILDSFPPYTVHSDIFLRSAFSSFYQN